MVLSGWREFCREQAQVRQASEYKQARLHRDANRAALLWQHSASARALRRWMTYKQQMACLRRTAAKVVIRWQHCQVGTALISWSVSVNEMRRSKAIAVKILLRWENLRMAVAWRAWLGCMHHTASVHAMTALAELSSGARARETEKTLLVATFLQWAACTVSYNDGSDVAS